MDLNNIVTINKSYHYDGLKRKIQDEKKNIVNRSESPNKIYILNEKNLASKFSGYPNCKIAHSKTQNDIKDMLIKEETVRF